VNELPSLAPRLKTPIYGPGLLDHIVVGVLGLSANGLIGPIIMTTVAALVLLFIAGMIKIT
jgi:hypothetical protein